MYSLGVAGTFPVYHSQVSQLDYCPKFGFAWALSVNRSGHVCHTTRLLGNRQLTELDMGNGLVFNSVLLVVFAIWFWDKAASHHLDQKIHSYGSRPSECEPCSIPGNNVFFDNGGTDLVTGVISRYAAGFGSGLLSDQAVSNEQDKLLGWDGWKQEMDRRKQSELRPGDPGEFTSIPNMEGILAKQFRENFSEVEKGKKVLYIFLTFKFFDQSGAVAATETCSWFSGTFARHVCGRARTFTEGK